MTNTDTAHAGTATGSTHDSEQPRCTWPAGSVAPKDPIKPAATRPAPGKPTLDKSNPEVCPDGPAGPVRRLTTGRLRRRPAGPFGLPIPAINGRPGPLGIDTTDFLRIEPARVLHPASHVLCGICDEPVRGGYAFLSGPLGHQARRSPNPPAHEDCLLASMGLCPYIARPGTQRATGPRAAHLSNRNISLDKPAVWVLGVTDSFHIEVFEDTGAVQVVQGRWTRARYFRYADGRIQETSK